MPKYRKKPIVIEAFRIGVDAIPDWAMDKVTDNTIALMNSSAQFLRDCVPTWCQIKTLEGTMTGEHGDYIIKGVKGEIYPCKPDIFEATYDVVDEPIPALDGQLFSLKDVMSRPSSFYDCPVCGSNVDLVNTRVCHCGTMFTLEQRLDRLMFNVLVTRVIKPTSED